MATNFTDFVLEKEAEFAETCSARPEPLEFEEEAGSDGKRGSVFAHIKLADDAYMKVWEKVVVKLGFIHREVYCYAVIIEGAHSESWERDPTHPEEPIHGHEGDGDNRIRKPCPVVSFKEALEMAWEIVTERELAPWTSS